MKFYSLVILILLLNSCSFSDEELKNGWWKYGGGYHIGDVIDFNKGNCYNDTIYKNDVPEAVLIDKIKYPFNLTKNKLIIKSIITGETGVYHQKK